MESRTYRVHKYFLLWAVNAYKKSHNYYTRGALRVLLRLALLPVPVLILHSSSDGRSRKRGAREGGEVGDPEGPHIQPLGNWDP